MERGEGRGIFSRYATEAESTYRQIHNKTIYVFLFLLLPENVSDLRFLLVWSAEIPGYTIPDKVHFTIMAHK